MANSKTKKREQKTKADLEIISSKENMLIDKEKRYQTELKKMRRPQVEKLTALKETKKKASPKVSSLKKASGKSK